MRVLRAFYVRNKKCVSETCGACTAVGEKADNSPEISSGCRFSALIGFTFDKLRARLWILPSLYVYIGAVFLRLANGEETLRGIQINSFNVPLDIMRAHDFDYLFHRRHPWGCDS